MKKLVSLLLALVLVVSVFGGFYTKTVSAKSSTKTTKQVQVLYSNYVNIKADPKTKRITTARKGSKYSYLGWTKGKGYARGAYKIKIGSKTGYISAKASKLVTVKVSTKKPAKKPTKKVAKKVTAKNPTKKKTSTKKPTSKSSKFLVNTKSTVKLNVKAINQRPQLPTGCEITAFTMMVNHAGGKGAKVTKMQMAKEMPRSSNPNKGFIGSPYNSSGVAIYPPALKKMTIKYTGSYKNMTSASVSQIKSQLKKGHVVMMWGRFVYWGINMSHTVALTGYDSKGFYYNDPMDGKKKYMTYKTMQYHYNQLGKRALSY